VADCHLIDVVQRRLTTCAGKGEQEVTSLDFKSYFSSPSKQRCLMEQLAGFESLGIEESHIIDNLGAARSD